MAGCAGRDLAAPANLEKAMSGSVLQDGKIFIGKSTKPEYLELRFANRHGLITGATGTGKTVTLQVLAEGFSAAGVPVFAADIKGDLSGIAAVGDPKDFLVKRAAEVGLGSDWQQRAYPTIFWDVFGTDGHPIRATVLDMGPLLLSRMLELTEVQEGVLNIAFRVAADEKIPVLDLKDLRAILANVSERSKELVAKYGNVATTSVGAIQRRLLVLEEQGAGQFFGEPALDIKDFMRIAPDGRGVISILTADKLMEKPRLYSTFLLWMLTKLWQAPARGRRPAEAEARLLLRRGASAVRRRPQGAARAHRADRPPDPLQGRRRLLHHAEPARRAELGLGSARQSRTACAARFHASRAEGHQGRRGDVPQEPGDQHRARHHGAQGRRGARLDAREQGRAVHGSAHAHPSARGPRRAGVEEERLSVIEYSPVFNKYEETIDRESAHEILTKRTDKAATDANSRAAAGVTLFLAAAAPRTRRRKGVRAREWAE